MSRYRIAIGVLAGLVLVPGCSAAGDPSATNSAATSDKSPLSEYLGTDFTSNGGKFRITVGGDQEPTEQQLAQRRRVEDAIASCMRSQGFRYVPVPPEANQKDEFSDAFRLPPGEFAEQYGYGISTMDFAGSGAEDPNTVIYDALSARAQAAYDVALDGEQEPDGGASSTKAAEVGPGGCRAEALDRVYGAGTAASKGADKTQEMRRFDSLFTDLEALRMRIQDDPEVAAAARTWSDCMADARQTGLAAPDDARERVAQRFDRLLADHKKDALVGPDSLRNIDPTELAELRRYELTMARADYDCRQQGYDTKYRDVQYAAEREFIQDHKTILDQFKDATAEGPR